MPGYEFDVFLSYSRHGGAGKWVWNNFYPKLADCLVDQVGRHPRIFVDKTMPVAAHWPSTLRKALQASKILLVVLSAPYFQSPWCMAELASMQEREKLLGLGGQDRSQGLICPILYSDSENYQEELVLHRQLFNFKDLGTSEPVFQNSPDWVLFHGRVTQLAEALAGLLKEVPEWRDDWPLIEPPEPLLMPDPPLPRF